MKSSDLEKLVKKDTYQVFLLGSPSNLPFSFGLHPWLVINKKGILERWEVLFRQKRTFKNRWGHLLKDYFSPFSGIEIIPFYEKFLWRGRLLGSIEGELARQCMEFIEVSPQTYPHCDQYSLLGPNSNTYAQWVINKFPQLGKLPANAIGKGYTR